MDMFDPRTCTCSTFNYVGSFSETSFRCCLSLLTKCSKSRSVQLSIPQMSKIVIAGNCMSPLLGDLLSISSFKTPANLSLRRYFLVFTCSRTPDCRSDLRTLVIRVELKGSFLRSCVSNATDSTRTSNPISRASSSRPLLLGKPAAQPPFLVPLKVKGPTILSPTIFCHSFFS